MIGTRARKHVLMEYNELPATIMFIGEGPGKTEDVLGRPFVGKAGQILRTAIGVVGLKSFLLTNLVACRPCDVRGGPNRQPFEFEINECAPRLQRVFALASPKIIVTLGRLAEEHTPVTITSSVRYCFFMYHPSYIARNGGVRSAAYREWLEGFKDLAILEGSLHGNS